MKLGVALDGGGNNHSQTCYLLSQLRSLGAAPDAYAVSAGQTEVLLGDLLKTDPKQVKTVMRRKLIRTFDDLPCPVCICAKNLFQNCDILFGSKKAGFSYEVPLSVFVSLSESQSFRLYHRMLLSARFVHTNSLLQALNKMGCDRYLVLGMSRKKREDTAKCLYLDILQDQNRQTEREISEALQRDYNRIFRFLYFS